MRTAFAPPATEVPGADRVFDPAGSANRGFFERLWGDGGFDRRDFGDLWNERSKWAGRDPLLGRGEKPGLETPAAGAQPPEDTTADAPRTAQQELQDMVGAMEAAPRRALEDRLDAMLERPMPGGRVDLDELARDPERFLADYAARLNEEDRSVFLTEIDALTGERRHETAIDPAAEEAAPEDDYEFEPSHSGMAFLAIAIGSGEAGRIHEYLRTSGSDASIIGDGSRGDSKDAEDRRIQKITQQMALIDSINQQIANNNYRIQEIDIRIREIDTEIANLRVSISEKEQQLETLDEEARALGTEHAELTQDIADLRVQDQALAVEEATAAVELHTATAEDVSAEAVQESALEDALRSRDGHAYAQDEASGQYVYIDGPREGELVPATERAAWWEEANPFTNRHSFQEHREFARRTEQTQRDVESAREELEEIRRQRDNIQQQIGEGEERLSLIEARQLAIEDEIRTIQNSLEQDTQRLQEREEERDRLELEKEELTRENERLEIASNKANEQYSLQEQVWQGQTDKLSFLTPVYEAATSVFRSFTDFNTQRIEAEAESISISERKELLVCDLNTDEFDFTTLDLGNLPELDLTSLSLPEVTLQKVEMLRTLEIEDRQNQSRLVELDKELATIDSRFEGLGLRYQDSLSSVEEIDAKIAELESKLAQIEQLKETQEVKLEQAIAVETAAIVEAAAATETPLVNYRGEVVHTDERFFGLGLSYEDPETGEIKEHNILESVAGQAAHFWQDLTKGGAKTGQEIQQAQTTVADASKARAEAEAALTSTELERQELAESIHTLKSETTSQPLPGASLDLDLRRDTSVSYVKDDDGIITKFGETLSNIMERAGLKQGDSLEVEARDGVTAEATADAPAQNYVKQPAFGSASI